MIPTIDPVLNYNLSEAKIIEAYRKYVPIVMKLLYNFECSEMRFWDEQLELVFNYVIWFEDRKGNPIPVDFNRSSKKTAESKAGEMSQEDVSRLTARSSTPLPAGQMRHFSPGITDKCFYEQIKSMCYPNAPADSLICYELFCLHSSKLREDRIDKQFKYLVTNIAKMSRNQF